MGKKYLETKETSLESSILGVWENAVSETVERAKANLDARTKEYKIHQERLVASRLRRENSKKLTKEEVEVLNITPDQIEEAFMRLDEQQIVLGEGTFTEEQCEIIDALQEMLSKNQ